MYYIFNSYDFVVNSAKRFRHDAFNNLVFTFYDTVSVLPCSVDSGRKELSYYLVRGIYDREIAFHIEYLRDGQPLNEIR